MGQSAFILRMAALLMVLVHGTDAKMEIISSTSYLMVGDDHFMLCKAGGEGVITWQKDGEDISEDNRKTVEEMDESSSKLLIKSIHMEDAGTYSCLCEFHIGHTNDVSYVLHVYEGPSFVSTHNYHEFQEGDEGIIPCLATGQPEVEIHWFRNQRLITNYGRNTTNTGFGSPVVYEGTHLRHGKNSTLYIDALRRDDAGTYECEAKIHGSPIFKKLPISVVVTAPPKVRLTEDVKKVMAGVENNITLLCLVDGLPTPIISWTVPSNIDPLRHHFNSDRSQLIIRSVTKDDHGSYICTAKNKLGESSASMMLHVSEAPEVYLSAAKQTVSVGKSVSVSCNVSGHPQPQRYWINKRNGQILDVTSGRVHAVNGVLMIDEVASSDGGLYSCMAVSPLSNASRDVAIHTQPGMPLHVTVSSGPTSVLFSLKTLPIDGGTPITKFILQQRQGKEGKWEETVLPASVPLAITSLKPYTSYTVRLAAFNNVGQGEFSDSHNVRTQGIREPDSPVLSSNQIRTEGNSFSVPLKQLDNGGIPLLHFSIRYREDKEGADWEEKQFPSNTSSVSLSGLSFNSDYHLEVIAVNANGSSNPAKLNFTISAEPVTKSGITKGGVVGIVMVIFLLLLVVVDATCCYTNRCGLLMFIAVKLFGQKIPGLKTLEEGEGTTNGELKLNGLYTPRGGMRQLHQQQAGVQTQANNGGQHTEVTCDKAPLTKYEKTPQNGDLPTIDA